VGAANLGVAPTRLHFAASTPHLPTEALPRQTLGDNADSSNARNVEVMVQEGLGDAVVHVAHGVLMGAHRVDSAQASKILTNYSRSARLSLHDAAVIVIDTCGLFR
jgi:hypothetical protein